MLGTLVAASHHDFLVVVQVVLGNGFYLLAHGGGEEEGVAGGGHALENLVDALRETHVEHLIGLVEHHVAHVVEMSHTAVHQVDEASWRGNDELHALAQCVDLVDDGGAAIYGHNPDARHIFGEILQVVANLQTEFTGRREDESLCRLVRGVDFLQEGDAVGSGLASAGLCQTDDVVADAEQVGDNLFLHGHGLFKPHFGNGAANIFAYAQFFECFQSSINITQLSQVGNDDT